jgi:hypothetical protein
VLYALLVVLGLAVYSPTLRAQIRAYEDAGPTSDEFKRASTRGTVLGAILAIDVIVIVSSHGHEAGREWLAFREGREQAPLWTPRGPD